MLATVQLHKSLPSAGCEKRLYRVTVTPRLFSPTCCLVILCFVPGVRKLIGGGSPGSEVTPYHNSNLKDFQNIFLSDLVKFPSTPLN